jgi:putative transposase
LREVGMSRKRFTMEQIIGLLREVDVKVSQGKNVGQICREIGITEQTYYRWRKEYGGMKTAQVKRLKELEKENSHLKKAVAELTLDKLILKEALEGNY